MNVEAASSSLNYSRVQASSSGTTSSIDSVSTRPARGDRDERQGQGTEGARPPRIGGKVADAVAQSFAALGITLPTPPTRGSAASAGTDQGPDASSAASGTNTQDSTQAANDIGQALQAFTYSLLQSLRPQDAGTEQQNPRSAAGETERTGGVRPPPPNGAQGYGNDLASKVQDLLQTVSNQSSASGNSTGSEAPTNTGSLNAAFKDLVQVLQKNGGGNASAEASQSAQASQVTLQSFLQNFAKNLQISGGSASSLGGAVNALA